MILKTAVCPTHGEPMVDEQNCLLCDGERTIARDQVEAITTLADAVEQAAKVTAEAVTEATEAVARSIIKLGNNDAGTPFGAIEALGMAHKDSMAALTEAVGSHGSQVGDVAFAINEHAEAVNSLTEAIRDGLALLATAIGNLGGKS
jgi:hypothetical protein